MTATINAFIDINDKNRIYHSNGYGDFIIIDSDIYDECTHYKIKFIYTGYEYWVTRSAVRYGRVRDPYYPSILGIACKGLPPDHHTIFQLHYSRWSNMIHRCYDPKHKSYKEYGMLGITVCDRWLCFEYYYHDVPLLPNYDKFLKQPNRYHLDKDYLQQNIPLNQRVYSPETCIWLEIRANSMQRDLVTNPNKVNKYHGVYGHNGRWYPEIQVYGQRVRLGSFRDEIAAANAYNNYIIKNIDADIPLNDVPYMAPDEVIEYNYGAKVMCTIIDKK